MRPFWTATGLTASSGFASRSGCAMASGGLTSTSSVTGSSGRPFNSRADVGDELARDGPRDNCFFVPSFGIFHLLFDFSHSPPAFVVTICGEYAMVTFETLLA